jgi:S-adenosylmethionine:tRNA ribosyltransferase-isomerase
MRVDMFHYDLPPELIAQRPAEERELARLMHLPPGEAGPEHRRVSEFTELLPPGALVVVNDTRVIPARLLGRKRDTGGRVEVLLVRRIGVRELEVAPGDVRRAEVWKALGKGSKPLKFDTEIEIPRPPVDRKHANDLDDPPVKTASATPRNASPGPDANLRIRLLGRAEDDGLLEVALYTLTDESVDSALHACGTTPLPPYIKREAQPDDAHRYQTVYARHDGAVAAPTAGLHVTNAMLGQLAVRGCPIASVTLHVGLGTFQPVVAHDFDLHRMHAESFVVSQATTDAIASARARGAPVIAIGTTTLRALESAADADRPGGVRTASGETRLLVQPGYRWRVVDGLLTNFHLPRSTLLALVCAFVGTERILDAYRTAVSERYRFFSYGDAMLVWRRG